MKLRPQHYSITCVSNKLPIFFPMLFVSYVSVFICIQMMKFILLRKIWEMNMFSTMMVWFMQAGRGEQVQIQPVGTSVKYAKQNTTISKHRALPRSVCASSIHVWHYFLYCTFLHAPPAHTVLYIAFFFGDFTLSI